MGHQFNDLFYTVSEKKKKVLCTSNFSRDLCFQKNLSPKYQQLKKKLRTYLAFPKQTKFQGSHITLVDEFFFTKEFQGEKKRND